MLRLRNRIFLSLFLGIILALGCSPEIKEVRRTVTVYEDKDDSKTSDLTADIVRAEFWGLPAIIFDGWRPEYHIKASTNNGELEGRTWDSITKNIFEYSQILFHKSSYTSTLIKNEDVTVDKGKKIIKADEKALFSEETKLYKKTPLPPEKIDKSAFDEIKTILQKADSSMVEDFEKAYVLDSTTGSYNKTAAVDSARVKKILETGLFLDKENVEDVVYDSGKGIVTIKLNNSVTGNLKLENGDKVAIISTNRPYQWHTNEAYNFVDYTIVDCLPKEGNVSLVNNNDVTIDVKYGTSSDRGNTRTIKPVTVALTGGVQTLSGNPNGWFEEMKIYEDKIELKMKSIKDGDTAKTFWDNADSAISGKTLKPFMLFWLSVDKANQ